MKLCRFDEDRLGVVVGSMVHDVTAAQDEIRKSARYDLAPAHRRDGEAGTRQAALVGQAALADRAPVKDHGGADQL
jgi:hypothetical protein